MRLLGAIAIVIGLCARAYAQDPDEQDDAPPPDLDTNVGQRRAVRGTSPESAEPAKDPDKEAQREWEEKTFPKELQPKVEDEVADPDAPPPDARTEWMKDLAVGDLPVRWDARVVAYLEFYKNDPKGQNLIKGWFKAQGRFRPLIEKSLKRHGLPADLIYLAMIESSYDPWVYSRVGASGIWQFMPAGGKVYGLAIDYWIDERNDPEKSTEAAMLYWKDLYERFGDWDLAMAAYNAGYGAVLKAIAKYNSNDFWWLLDREGGLPWGSTIYVPKALAVSVVGHNRALFGLEGLAEEPTWEFDRVTVPKSISLAVAGKAAGVTANDIAWLNPELRRGRTPPGVKDYALRIPKGTKEKFAKTFRQLTAEWDGYDEYVVRHGERFEDIARVHGVSVATLRELNGAADVSEVRGGLLIVVPHVDEVAKAKNRQAAEDDLYRSEVTPGVGDEPMIVAVPDKDLTIDGRKRVFYRVVAGDTLDQIAAVLGVRTAQLAAWNELDTEAKIQPRMVIVAWVKPEFDADKANVALLDDARLMLVTSGSVEHIEIMEGRKGRKRKTIKAKQGQTLEAIGKPHHLSKYDMARINRRSPAKETEAGEELVIYVVVDKAKAKKAGVYDKKKRKLEPPTRPKKPSAKKQ